MEKNLELEITEKRLPNSVLLSVGLNTMRVNTWVKIHISGKKRLILNWSVNNVVKNMINI